jgi:hypothetical protein
MTDPERGQIRHQPSGLPRIRNPSSAADDTWRAERVVRHQRTSGDLRLERGGRALLRICASAWTRGFAESSSRAEGLLAPPIRMLVGGAGEVHLVPFVSQIIELHHGEPGPCAGEKSVHGVGQLRAKWAGRVEIGQPPARRPRVPGGAPRVPSLAARAGPVLRPRSDKAHVGFSARCRALPTIRAGCEIVAARRGQRERRIVCGCTKAPSASNSKNSTR